MKFNLKQKVLTLIILVQLSAILVIDKFAVNSNISDPLAIIFVLIIIFIILDLIVFKLSHRKKETMTI